MAKSATATASVPQATPAGFARAWFQGPLADLFRFLAIVTLLCSVACLYFWQASSIAAIRSETDALHGQVAMLERDNAALMLQVAAWNRPEYIRMEALAKGMGPATGSAYVQVAPEYRPLAAQPPSDNFVGWWREIIDEWQARWSTQASAPGSVARAGQ
jgi:hypothetical protein